MLPVQMQMEKHFMIGREFPRLNLEEKTFFSSTDHMGSFFEYDYIDLMPSLIKNRLCMFPIIRRSCPHRSLATEIKRVWAAGTKTWFELAKKGIWVEGSADAFGLEFLSKPGKCRFEY